MRSSFAIYCDILRRGLLNIRIHSSDQERCFAEADHLHNIPELLGAFENEALHRYYWDVMRPCFIKTAKPEWLSGFHELWQELELANRTADRE